MTSYEPMPAVVLEASPQWRRLSPRMLLVHPILEAGKAIPAIAGAVFAGHGSLGGNLWATGIATVVMALGVLRWATTKYVIGAQQVQLRTGLIRRRSITTRIDRVRTVDVTSHVLHRALGIARVVIGTGISDRKNDDRLVLDGLGVAQAARLRDELLHRAAQRDATALGAADGAGDETLVALDPRWVRYGPFTLTGAVTGLALLGLCWRIVTEGNVHLDRFALARAVERRLASWTTPVDVLVVLLGVMAFVVVASTIGYVLSFWRFTLARNPAGSLHVSRGLLTTRRTSIERRRLVGAELSEPLLLRWGGGARVLAITTGLRVGRGAERGGEILLPPAPRALATALAADVADAPRAFTGPLVPHPRAALRRRMIRACMPALVLTASVTAVVAAAGLSWWLVVAAAGSVVLAVPLALDRYRSLGHALLGSTLVVRSGSIVRSRSAVDVSGIVGWTFRRSWFQRRLGLATLVATTAAGRQHYQVTDLDERECVAFADSVVPELLIQFRADDQEVDHW